MIPHRLVAQEVTVGRQLGSHSSVVWPLWLLSSCCWNSQVPIAPTPIPTCSGGAKSCPPLKDLCACAPLRAPWQYPEGPPLGFLRPHILRKPWSLQALPRGGGVFLLGQPSAPSCRHLLRGLSVPLAPKKPVAGAHGGFVLLPALNEIWKQ